MKQGDVSDVIQGERLALRPVTPQDVPRLGKMLEEPSVAKWWPNYGEDRLREDLYGEKPGVTAFVMEAEGTTAGLIWYYEELDPQYRMAGIDLFVAADWQGKGLGGDALRSLANHLFTRVGHHRIIIDPAVSNERAVHVYGKVGFKPVGVMRRYERLPDGTFRDGLLMDMLPEDLA